MGSQQCINSIDHAIDKTRKVEASFRNEPTTKSKLVTFKFWKSIEELVYLKHVKLVFESATSAKYAHEKD